MSKSLTLALLLLVSTGARAQTLTTVRVLSSPGLLNSDIQLVKANDGNIYGTTIIGGGSLFKITADGLFTVLHQFCGTTCNDGVSPNGVIQATDGNFYGTTVQGGSNGYGTIFRITPDGTLTTLHSFCAPSNCAEGAYPSTQLVQGSDGSLYGTTPSGGLLDSNSNHGSIFKITLSGVLTKLYTFCQSGGSCVEGWSPNAALVEGPDGNFYGSTTVGDEDNGTIFKVTPTGSLTAIDSYAGTSAPLVFGSDGNLYGTGLASGYNSGYGGDAVFKITTTGQVTFLYTFCALAACEDGFYASSGLILAKDGFFYGTTLEGGSFFYGGTIFRVTPSGVLSTLYTFCDSQGDCPDSGGPRTLVQSSTGVIYGSTGTTIFKLTLPGSSAARGGQADFFGSGKASYTVWRPATGYWYSSDGAGNSTTRQWGAPTDLSVIGDFDGDGKSDFAVFRPSNGYWYITQSSNGEVVAKQWGVSTDTPVAGDFDGDGKTDLTVFRPSTGYWFIVQSSNGDVVAKQWGASSDMPVVGDFDGDGKSDIAVFRPSTGYWYVVQSSNGEVVTQQWGAPTDLPVSGDFDGDGKTDIAVYRPSTGYWFIVQSSNGQVVSKQWGAAGDVPVARDYDGDGKTDIAVWRPSTGYWYVIESSTGQTRAQQWGAPTDIPVNNLVR